VQERFNGFFFWNVWDFELKINANYSVFDALFPIYEEIYDDKEKCNGGFKSVNWVTV